MAAGLGMAIVAPPLLADHVPVRNEDAKLLASDGQAEDFFGEAVAVSGGTILVGARFDDDQGEDSGAAYVFERDETGGWVETAKLLPSDGRADHWFGERVAVAGDTLVVATKRDGDQGEDAGAVYVFEQDVELGEEGSSGEARDAPPALARPAGAEDVVRRGPSLITQDKGPGPQALAESDQPDALGHR